MELPHDKLVRPGSQCHLDFAHIFLSESPSLLIIVDYITVFFQHLDSL